MTSSVAVPGDETTSCAFDFDSDSKVKPDHVTADILKDKESMMRNGALQAPSGFKVADIAVMRLAADAACCGDITLRYQH